MPQSHYQTQYYSQDNHQFPRPPSETLPTMHDLPSEDPDELGLPDEFHYFQPDLLRKTCKLPIGPSNEVFIGTNLNLYYDSRHPLWHKRPDWFLCLGVTIADRQEDLRWSYVLLQESVSPFLVVELLSPGTEKDDLGSKVRELGKSPTKWEVYERILRVPFYIIYDRYENQFRVFTLRSGQYEQLELIEPKFWFDQLELGLGVWQGVHHGIEDKWLRWYDAAGNWVSTDFEARQTAEAAQKAAEAEAETERSARQTAEAEANAERLARRSAIPRLLSLGLTPEQIAAAIGLSITEVEDGIES